MLSSVVIAIYLSCECLLWPFAQPRRQQDVEEEGRGRYQNILIYSNDQHIEENTEAIIENNMRFMEMLNRIIRAIEERKERIEERIQKALEKMHPPMKYGVEELECASTSVCAICLVDFEAGESYQAYPMCNHIFHSNCIHSWSKKNLTCPICRSCISDDRVSF